MLKQTPLYELSEGDDFVDVSDIFLDAAQGMTVTSFLQAS
jgi:hypothetical protein